MSFILDALKKSEADRQQQAGGEFSNVPSSSGEPQSFKWLWILAILLLVNFAVLLGILMRDDEATPAEEATQAAQQASGAETPAQQARAGSSFEEKSRRPAEISRRQWRRSRTNSRQNPSSHRHLPLRRALHRMSQRRRCCRPSTNCASTAPCR